MGGSGYGLVTVIGGFVLLAVIVVVTLRNRGARGGRRTEQATRDLYDKIDREGPEGVPPSGSDRR